MVASWDLYFIPQAVISEWIVLVSRFDSYLGEHPSNTGGSRPSSFGSLLIPTCKLSVAFMFKWHPLFCLVLPPYFSRFLSVCAFHHLLHSSFFTPVCAGGSDPFDSPVFCNLSLSFPFPTHLHQTWTRVHMHFRLFSLANTQPQGCQEIKQLSMLPLDQMWFDVLHQYKSIGPFLIAISLLAMVLSVVTTNDSGSILLNIIGNRVAG